MVGWIAMILRVFFWWWNGNETIHDDTQPVINQLVDTWNQLMNTWTHQASSWNSEIISNQTWTQLPNETVEIRLMMPRYFYTAGRKNFAQDLYTQQKIYIKFNFVDNLNTYKSFVYNNQFDQADVILIPYDRIENISTRPFTFQQNLSTAFDQLISPIVNSDNISFLPFAADPVVMYTAKWYEAPSNFSEIFEFISNWNPKNPLYFPIFFWITSEDYENEWFLREYQDIIRYSLMHYFTTYRDSNSLWKRIDSNVFENYNINDLNSISNAISAPACKDFPSICFQLYNFVAIRFGFLSDADIVKQYFSNKKSEFSNTSKEPTIFSTLESPVRIRWWSIPTSLQNVKTINWVYSFLVYYMNNHDKYDLRSSSLSTFTWNTRLFDNVFIWLRWYILQSGWNFIKDSINAKSFWQLIEYQISAKDYLRKI